MLLGLPNFSRLAAALQAHSFAAGMIVALILVIVHDKIPDKFSHVCGVRERERNAHWCVGMGSVAFDIET